MSLQVWLPLTGNLHNQGLSEITYTGTPTFKSVGKIGAKSYDLNYRTTITCPDLTNKSRFTIAFWAKVNTDTSLTTNWVDVIGFTDKHSNGTTGQLRWETCYANSSTRGISGHDNAIYATTNGPNGSPTTKDTWHHIVCVVGDDVREYRNGKLTGTYTANGGTLTGVFWLGEAGKVNGEINDVRIYDECLDPLEVKRLSQGLVLHYPLNNNGLGGTNLLNNPTKFTAGGAASGNTKTVLDDGIVQVVAASGNSNWVRFADSDTTLPLTKGDTFTFSIRIRSDDSTKNPTVYFNDGLGYFTMQGQMSKEWTTIYYTGTWSIDKLNTMIHLGFSSAPGTYYIQSFKLERGNKPTPFIDNVVFEKSGLIVSNWGSAEGSRLEFRYLDTGTSFHIQSGEKLMVSFDFKMIINTAPSSGSAPYFIMYNSNYRGPHGNWTYVNFNTELAGTYAVGDVIEKRINKIVTVGALNPGTRATDGIEFYSNYGSNNWYEIKNLKIERYNDIEYDVSGYGRNSTLSQNIQTVSNSPRYLTSTYFNGSAYIQADPLPSEVKTISCWVKTDKPSTNQFYWCDTGTAMCLATYNGHGTVITYYKQGGQGAGSKCTLSGSKWNSNGWNHFVVIDTGNGTRDVYCNGEKLTPTSNDWYGTVGSKLVIGNRGSGAVPLYGYVSDFRAYATQLSPDDIKALYENSAYIATDGTAYAYEFVEE